MTRTRRQLLTACVVAACALAAPGAVRAGDLPPCLRAAIPPTPPPGGAVLAVPLDPDSDDPNVIVLQFGYGPLHEESFVAVGCDKPARSPRFIAVDPGVALVFSGLNGTDVVWGGVNVDWDDDPPVIYDGADPSWGRVTAVSVEEPVATLRTTTRCPGCDLSGAKVTLSPLPAPGTSKHLGKPGDLFLADLRGATVSGNGRGYVLQDASIAGATFDGVDFTNASFDRVNVHIEGNGHVLQGAKFSGGTDLSGANFTLAFLAHSTFDDVIVDGASFLSASLQGVRFSGLRFRAPPQFDLAELGGDVFAPPGTPCTSFVNLDLVDVDFDRASWSGQGCSGSLFPGSTVRLSLLAQLLQPTFIADALDLSDTQVLVSAAERTRLAGANLRGAKLAGADFLGEQIDLTGTALDGADLTRTNLSLARLAGATFANVAAAGASFTGADLTGDGTRPAASFAGPRTNLQGANFVNADISGASFQGADLSDAVFTGARGNGTDFGGVIARHAVFAGAHLYGNGQAFNQATDMEGVDFTDAVLASDPTLSGGFDFTNATLTDAHFDRAVCVACNFTNAHLPGASFTEAYLPGVVLAGATLTGADLDRAWLYCGNVANASCAALPGSPPRWSWRLDLGSGEAYGPIPFAAPDLSGESLADVTACPDGKAGSVPPAGCTGHLLPNPSEAPPIPAPCSPSADGACSTPTSTVFDAAAVGAPLAIVAAAPPTWNTTLSPDGWYVAFDDGTVRLVGDGTSQIIAGSAGTHCAAPRDACGDGGPATAALLGMPSGLAVGIDGAVYIADPALLRVRRIDPASHAITTVAGGGGEGCDIPCGDGGPAIDALLAAASDVAVDPLGALLIAEGGNGVRRVARDGTISTVAAGTATGRVRAVTASADGVIYASTSAPDHLIAIDPNRGAVTTVVGTGTSGYNGNTDRFGLLAPGTAVEINGPQGLAVDLDGNVVFADTGNDLIRAYVPSSGHVIDVIAGSVGADGMPKGGFNGDGHRASRTQLQAPRSVTAASGALRVVADTGNRRIRLVGPGPKTLFGSGNPGEPTPARSGGGGCAIAPDASASAGVALAAIAALHRLISRRRRSSTR